MVNLNVIHFTYFSGWFVVWKMFLIRFSFIWELVYGGSNGNINKTSENVPLRRSSRIRDMRSRKFWTMSWWASDVLVLKWTIHPQFASIGISALCILAKNTKLSYTLYTHTMSACSNGVWTCTKEECLITVSGMTDCHVTKHKIA